MDVRSFIFPSLKDAHKSGACLATCTFHIGTKYAPTCNSSKAEMHGKHKGPSIYMTPH